MKKSVVLRGDISPKKKVKLIDHLKAHYWLYIMLIPGLTFILIFNYIPMYGISIAFKDYDMVKGIFSSDWVGLKNFRTLFHSSDFLIVLKNSVLISFYRLIFGFPAPIILALMLNEVRNSAFKKTIQTFVYLPHFISWVVLGGMIINLLSTTGVVNYILGLIGIEPIQFLQKPQYFRSIIVITDIWKEVGWGTIIYLAAMTGIDQSLYEAASIDGASKIGMIFHVTIPGIMNTVVVMLILRVGSILRNGFEQIFMLYNPLVYDVADVFETYTYRIGVQDGLFSYSTAVGLFQSLVGFIFVIATNKISKSVGESGLW